MISQVKHDLIKTCTEFMFKELISNTKTVSEEIDAETDFPIPTRPYPRNRFFNYEAVDEPITDPESNCTKKFLLLFDRHRITKLHEQFKPLNKNNISFSFLQNLNYWKNFNSEEKRMFCLNLQQN